MRDEDETFQETTRWSEIIDLYNGTAFGPEFLTVRYVGQCQGPTRPYDRFMKDLRQRSSGILHDFTCALEILYPEIRAAVEVYLLKAASVDLITTASREVVSRYIFPFVNLWPWLKHEDIYNAAVSDPASILIFLGASIYSTKSSNNSGSCSNT